MNHYYRLHFVCEPGGSRKTEYHVLGTLDEVKEAVRGDLNSPEGAYHALLYGELIRLQYWEDGRKVAVVDLHPYIRYQLSDREGWITFPDEAGVAPLALDEMDGDGVPLYDKIFDERVTVKAVVDWDAIELPKTNGDPLAPGTEATFVDDGFTQRWAYGFHGDWDRYVR